MVLTTGQATGHPLQRRNSGVFFGVVGINFAVHQRLDFMGVEVA